MSTGEIDPIYRKICSRNTLQEKREGFFRSLVDTLSPRLDPITFCRCATDLEKVKLVATRCWDSIGAELIFRGKKPEEAVANRVEGNKYFEKGDYQKALLYYCRSIVQAPVGPELINVYSNRSALFQKMGEYDLAITDAELAISYGSPENTRHKLYERMASCHLAVKNHHKAKVILRLAKVFADKHDKDNEKFAKKLEKLSSAIAKVSEVNLNEKTSSQESTSSPNFKPSKKFPSISGKLDVKYSPGYGRYAFATKDIGVGEEVLREKPYAACLKMERLGTHCLNCFKRLKAPIACETCSNAAFCSRECKKEGESYHRYECRIMALLLGSGMSMNAYLAFRIVTQSSLERFKAVIPELGSPNYQEVLLESNGSFDPTSYLAMYNLAGLEDQRTYEDFLDRTIMAVFLMKCLRLVDYFDINIFKTPLPTEDELQIGAIILRNLQVLQFNAYEVCEFLMESKTNYKKSTSYSLGLAIYSTASYMNHSCAPDVTRYFIGTTMVSTTIKGVKANQPIFDNYGPNFIKESVESRREKLSGRYWFHCTCDGCLNNWPTLQASQTEIEPKTPEEARVLKKLQKLEPLYFDTAMKAMEAGKVKVATELFKKHLAESEALLEDHKESNFYPYKTSLLTQEGMKLCLCSMGSVFISNTKPS